MPTRRILPAFLFAALLTLCGFDHRSYAQEPMPAEPAKVEEKKAEENPDPAKTAAMVKDVNDGRDTAIRSADITWILISSALVMLMLPGLALFYGGMARRKNVLGTMMHTMVALGLVGVQWVTFGYSIAFGDPQTKISISSDSKGEPIEGSLFGFSKKLLCLSEAAAVPVSEDDIYKKLNIDKEKATEEEKETVAKDLKETNKYNVFPNTKLPLYLHAMFQGMFAIITVALISGAFAERVKFSTYLIFSLIWTTVVYDPIAHWVWAFDWGSGSASGILGVNGAIDFAGGTVVHIAAGFSGLAAVLFLRKRIGYGKQSFHPNSMVLTLLGAGLLWFGWFGFNGGSALMANGQAVSAFTVTQIAAAVAGMTWLIIEWLHRGKPTALGFASGLVAGLVAITPASGFVGPGGALAIGVAAGIGCYLAVVVKGLLGYDDSLDAFGVHGVGGLIGAILTGVFVSLPLWAYGAEMDPSKFGGKLLADAAVPTIDYSSQISWQIKASAMSAIYAFVATSVLVLVLEYTIGFSVKPTDEGAGLDLSQHGETGFDMGPDVDAGAIVEPKSATNPPSMAAGKAERFTVVLDGADATKLRTVWVDMCKPYEGKPRKEFDTVYKYLTTISGNKFRFRGGNPADIKAALAKLFSDALNQSGLQAHVEH